MTLVVLPRGNITRVHYKTQLTLLFYSMARDRGRPRRRPGVLISRLAPQGPPQWRGPEASVVDRARHALAVFRDQPPRADGEELRVSYTATHDAPHRHCGRSTHNLGGDSR